MHPRAHPKARGCPQPGDVTLAFSGEHVVTAMCDKGSLRNIAVLEAGLATPGRPPAHRC